MTLSKYLKSFQRQLRGTCFPLGRIDLLFDGAGSVINVLFVSDNNVMFTLDTKTGGQFDLIVYIGDRSLKHRWILNLVRWSLILRGRANCVCLPFGLGRAIPSLNFFYMRYLRNSPTASAKEINVRFDKSEPRLINSIVENSWL